MRRSVRFQATARAVLLAAAAVLLTTLPASAATVEHDHTSSYPEPVASRTWDCFTLGYGGESKARACFAREGDWWYVYDMDGDGRSAVAQWGVISEGGSLAREGRIWHTMGGETLAYQNKDYREDRSLVFRVCTGAHSSHGLYRCTEERYTTT